MIIVFMPDKLTMKAANMLAMDSESIQIYPNVKFTGIQDTTLTLIDLSGDGQFQRAYADGVSLAEALLAKGLPATIQHIELLVSDVDKTERLSCVGQLLQGSLKAKGHDSQVHASFNDNFDTTFLLPDDTKKTWQYWGIARLGNLSKDFKITVNNLLQSAYRNNIKEIEEISDIRAWLHDPVRSYDPFLFSQAQIKNRL